MNRPSLHTAVKSTLAISLLAALAGCHTPQTPEESQEVVISASRHEAQRRVREVTAKEAYLAMADVEAMRVLAAPPPEQLTAPPQQKYDDQFEAVETNPVKLVTEEPVSTFSADVDTASYSFVRKRLNSGYLPDKDAVRLEEMVNYFDYDYLRPVSADKPFKPTVVVHDSPWAENRKLVHIGIQGYELQAAEQPDSNLVFLLDVSGSMDQPDKLPLVKQSLKLLLNTLKPTDKVSIVVYAGAAGVVLEPTAASDTAKISAALNKLEAGGSTAGGEGLQLAYALAEQSFSKDAVNRIILATDGDFNVGIYDRDELKQYVERKRENGIYLSVIGFGRGNYNDALMQSLAQNGNGIAAYIDTLGEAQKIFVEEATSSLFPIATDLKIQVEFNPRTVREYRLLGYETRALNREDFNNDNVDAGDIGSGHAVTAIYEITLTGQPGLIDDLRYAESKTITGDLANEKSGELGYLKLRYKRPSESVSELIEQPVNIGTEVSASLMQEVEFASAVAGFAQLLKDSKYTGNLSLDDVLNLAVANKGTDYYGYRAEFTQLVRQAKVAEKAEF